MIVDSGCIRAVRINRSVIISNFDILFRTGIWNALNGRRSCLISCYMSEDNGEFRLYRRSSFPNSIEPLMAVLRNEDDAMNCVLTTDSENVTANESYDIANRSLKCRLKQREILYSRAFKETNVMEANVILHYIVRNKILIDHLAKRSIWWCPIVHTECRYRQIGIKKALVVFDVTHRVALSSCLLYACAMRHCSYGVFTNKPR